MNGSCYYVSCFPGCKCALRTSIKAFSGVDRWFILRDMGWIVSNKYRFIFIHIPKTGGTSLAEPCYQDGKGVLTGLLGETDYIQAGHIRAVGLKERMGEHWDMYFKFAFVRNPWDRMVSLYHYFLQEPEKRASELGRRIAACDGFTAFCSRLEDLELDAHFDEQISYLIDFHGNLLVDYIGRFETLDQDYANICSRLALPVAKLPHYRKSSHQHYLQYYNERSKNIVAERYRNDIAAFNYSSG